MNLAAEAANPRGNHMQQADTNTAGGPPQIAPGTRLREYETIFLVRPDLAEDLVDKIVERMRRNTTSTKGLCNRYDLLRLCRRPHAVARICRLINNAQIKIIRRISERLQNSQYLVCIKENVWGRPYLILGLKKRQS